jgi:hypothetical protein
LRRAFEITVTLEYVSKPLRVAARQCTEASSNVLLVGDRVRRMLAEG